MGNPAGMKRDFVALEERRLRAARLLSKGISQSEVARQVGAHRQSVSRWAQQLEREGRAGLKRVGRAGRKPRLGGRDRERIARALKGGPEQLGDATKVWTAVRVARLIEQAGGVRYHPGHVWKLLRQLGWSCQRPAGRALERDEAAIRSGKRKRRPEIKNKPKKSGERSSLSMKAD
jgi:transposase